ncbi:Thymidylate kinase [archaeon HR01]|nr:Thymidylate kinase [archaeon HR01]
MGRRRGYLIAVEGVDGAGKTTQARLLVRKLERMGVKAVYTCEPSDSPVGRLVRRHLRKNLGLSEESVALLFAADRLEHLKNFIYPGLARGLTIVSDRYIHSSIAYQSAATGRREWVEAINSLAPEPDLSIFIDLPVETSLGRIGMKKVELYERRRFLNAVRMEYLRLVRGGRMVRVDGRGSRSEIAERIIKVVMRRMR